MQAPFSKILIANRGEIAVRVIRTAQRMNIRTVAVYSDADANAYHVEAADEAVRIGPPAVAESYLNVKAIIAAALETGAEAVHPGYGFLSENPNFVDAVQAAGLVFIGPSAHSIRAMGLKDAAKNLMIAAGVPVVPGYQGANQDADFLATEAEKIGFPVLIKARAGGGGKGMRKVDAPEQFHEALASAQREGKSSFGDPTVLIEKYVTAPRHIEVQVFGDSHGNAVHLFERDCSLQRRHQKVIEEAPAPGMTEEMRAAMTEAAVRAAKAIDYAGAGTIEFIADGSGPLRPDGFWFMEMNTRLQVEHPVTEAITGVDLVEWQIRVAAGEPLPMMQQQIEMRGHAFEARLYAEDPANGFLPSTGRIEYLAFSPDARCDTGVRQGDEITPWYDPMIAKIITHGADRSQALAKLVAAVRGTHVAGTVTNAPFLARLAENDKFREVEFDTGLIDRNVDELTSAPELSEIHLAFAAIAMGRHGGEPAHRGWRLWGEARQEVTLFHVGERVRRWLTYSPDGSIVVSGGTEALTLSAVSRDHHKLWARLGDTRRVVEADIFIGARSDHLLVSVLAFGVTVEFTVLDPRMGDAAIQDVGNAVVAPMTGVVVELSVQAGDRVSAGDRLGVMEAMKMETSLVAQRDGIVSSVNCAKGETVEGGAVLILFGEEPG